MGEGNYLTSKEKETNGEIASCCGRTWFCIEQEANFLLAFMGAKPHFSSELRVLTHNHVPSAHKAVAHAWINILLGSSQALDFSYQSGR